jgi:hypothetical protein
LEDRQSRAAASTAPTGCSTPHSACRMLPYLAGMYRLHLFQVMPGTAQARTPICSSHARLPFLSRAFLGKGKAGGGASRGRAIQGLGDVQRRTPQLPQHMPGLVPAGALTAFCGGRRPRPDLRCGRAAALRAGGGAWAAPPVELPGDNSLANLRRRRNLRLSPHPRLGSRVAPASFPIEHHRARSKASSRHIPAAIAEMLGSYRLVAAK